MSDTVLDRLVGSITLALEYNPNVQVAPTALLWPDQGRQWEIVIDRFAERLPLLTLGDHDPAARRGPAYWIRCVVGGTIDARLPEGTPIIYMPGVARSDLRAVESCPSRLAPIAEVQYRSQWFSHPNSRDWSVRALLSHKDDGLGFAIAEDYETAASLPLALAPLLDEPAEPLVHQVLDADYLHNLVSPDPQRTLLGWLNDAKRLRERLDDSQWAAFVQQCKSDYKFDPMLDGELTAARLLAGREGKWAAAWGRFAETPELYPGIPEQLRRARPQEQLSLGDHPDSEVWPQDNEVGEDQLRSLLHDVSALTTQGARIEISRLDDEHAWRRRTVWARLDRAPLAFALEQLVALAELTTSPLVSDDLQPLSDDYVERGWRADDAMLRSLAAANNSADRAAVSAAAAVVYRPWVDAGAKSLQSLIGPMANAGTYAAGPPASASPGTVSLFVDGLRLDIGQRIRERLREVGLDADASTSLAALPTVTQTAKAAMAPVAERSLVAGPDLHAANAATGTKATIQVLRALMEANGVQILSSASTGDPTGSAWAEAGEIDERGHDFGVRLVDHLEEEVNRIVARVREMLEAGWSRVELITDHGWLLVPGGMEKVALSPATVEIKKGRCARLKDGATVEAPTVPWYWDQHVRIALAPGATCFESGKEYEHGGVSPQECIVPRLIVTAATRSATRGPEIAQVKWLGMLCRIDVANVEGSVVADLRALAADATTSIAKAAKETSNAGRMSLLVPDEELEGQRVHLVLVSVDGQILAQRDVVVGQNR